MGVAANITHNTFPRQGEWVGQRVRVCFNYNTQHWIGGTVVRDDKEEPYRAIIQLDDGRYVLTTECQHSHPRSSDEVLSAEEIG